MPNMQKENNEETTEKKSKRSMVSQALTLEGKEVRRQSARIKVVEQDSKTVLVRIALEDKNFIWYTITVRMPKKAIKNIYRIPEEE